MDRLAELTAQHKFIRNGYRTILDQRPENRVRYGGRTWLRKGPYSNTVRGDHPIVRHVQSMGIPCNAVCLNRKRAESPPMGPHRDACNSGNSFIAFWGDYDGGALVCEDGRRFTDKEVWHECGDLSQCTHWVEPHSSGIRYSAVAFTGPVSTRRASASRSDRCKI